MEYLKKKSEINEISANLLYEKGLHPSVIHCSYYSCFQLMKYAFHKKTGQTEDDRSETESGSSHSILINHILNILYPILERQEWKVFQKNIGELKRLRVKADYKNEEIDSSISNESIRLSKAIIVKIKKI